MKKYFVVSDIHSYYTQLKTALKHEKFDKTNADHILIICGDLFDRGPEANQLLKFLLSLPKDRLILVRGNHEDLFEDCLQELKARVNISHHHWMNGTLDTIDQLTGISKYDLVCGLYNYKDIDKKLKKYFSLINNCINYYETNNYICVHGWIPVNTKGVYYIYNSDWRNANEKEWYYARWYNGMDMANNGIIEPNKTIICGHWHTGYGHCKIKQECSTEFENLTVYINKGITAIDGCVPRSGKINVFTFTE